MSDNRTPTQYGHPLSIHYTYSRFLEEPSQAAAYQQEELLGKEDPGDLLQGGLSLTPQVQNGGSQEGDAQAEAKEHTPVGESMLPVVLKQRPDPLIQQLHVDLSELQWPDSCQLLSDTDAVELSHSATQSANEESKQCLTSNSPCARCSPLPVVLLTDVALIG